ncbi:MAG: C2H2-type zinc finger protein [Candidatus Nezhaarchaeales archaeon]
MSSNLFNIKEKRERNFPQTIWLKTSVFQKVLELSSELGLAPNKVCSLIIERYLAGGEPLKVVEKTVKETIIECPYCYEKFQDFDGLRKHLKEHVNEILEEE